MDEVLFQKTIRDIRKLRSGEEITPVMFVDKYGEGSLEELKDTNNLIFFWDEVRKQLRKEGISIISEEADELCMFLKSRMS